MNIILLIIIALVFVGVVTLITKQKRKQRTETEDSIGNYFELKKHFFTHTEKPFFDELQKQNNGQHTILSKVRLEDIVSAKKGLNWKERGLRRNYIKSRHIDFIILSKETGKILSAIELDGKSHNTEKQGKYDKIKDDILNSVNIKFYRIKVGEKYLEEISSIFTGIEVN